MCVCGACDEHKLQFCVSAGYIFGRDGLLESTSLGSPDWHVSMVDIHLRKLLWVYCPGHAGVKGNDRADRLAALYKWLHH